MVKVPETVLLNWDQQYRIIPSVFPPINLFEDLVDPSQMEEAFYIEGLTNDRIREEVGDINLVAKEDHISGKGSSIIMAAFTHIGKISRFSDGTHGVYYASKTLETAIKETVFHREKFLALTQEQAMDIDMRVYVGKILKPFHDLRSQDFIDLHNPMDYKASQKAGIFLKNLNTWGVVYNSVRDRGGECIGVFRPPAISIPIQTKHLTYAWNGKKITDVYEKSLLTTLSC